MFRENETPKKVGNGTGKGLSVPRSDPFPATTHSFNAAVQHSLVVEG